MLKYTLILSLFLFSAAALAGCGLSCTNIGCDDNVVTMQFLDADGQPLDAPFQGALTIDGETSMISCDRDNGRLCCDFTEVSWKAKDAFAEDNSECELRSGEGLKMRLTRDTNVTMSWALDTEAGESGQGETRVDFESFEPNGAGCGPMCDKADVTLALE